MISLEKERATVERAWKLCYRVGPPIAVLSRSQHLLVCYETFSLGYIEKKNLSMNHSGCLEASYRNIAVDQRRNDGSLDSVGIVEGSEI